MAKGKRKSRKGRPPGSREADHDQRRRQILEKLAGEVFLNRRVPALKGLAEIAGVSVATLVHYFGTRDEVCCQLLAFFREQGEKYELPLVRTPAGSLEESITHLCHHIVRGFRGPLQAIHEFGFVESLRSRPIAEAYLSEILDPTIDAITERLREHARRGEYHGSDPRLDAIQIIAPLLLAAFHQQAFGGGHRPPLPLENVAHSTAQHFFKKILRPN